MKHIYEYIRYGGHVMTARQLARRVRRGEKWRPVGKEGSREG